MAIHVPGKRFRYSRLLSRRNAGRRSVVAILSLTAMVDMFTVLVIFLLQNYNDTGQTIELPSEVKLPQASSVKQLPTAVVVTVSPSRVLIDNQEVLDTESVRRSESWMIDPVYLQLQSQMALKKQEEEKKLSVRMSRALNPEGLDAGSEKQSLWDRVTLQADKSVDFLTVKKVMFTITEAGAREINFAVLQSAKK